MEAPWPRARGSLRARWRASWAGVAARPAHWPGSGARRASIATFVTLGLAYGVWYSYSVFLVAFLREFGWSRSMVAGAFSIVVLVHGLSGPLVGWLVERFGPRAVVASGGAVLSGALLLAAQIEAAWQLYAVFGVLSPSA
jgi:MFS family permease